MSTAREMALDVLRGCLEHPGAADSIAALEAELAQTAEVVEPVGQVVFWIGRIGIAWAGECPPVGTQIYTAPQEPAVNAELLAALQGVLRVADRKTDEFDAARAAIAKAVRS